VRPFFTIHAGEYLVGAHIEHHFKRANVWIPLRDTGIDLLVSDRRNAHHIALQVKFSKDFLVTHMKPAFQKNLRACGWWTLNMEKLRASRADFWVFVLQGFASRSTDFVVVPRPKLLARLRAIHGTSGTVQSYLWVTEDERCWETRGLSATSHDRFVHGLYEHPHRDFSEWLNDWSPIAALNR
jgi:hypothetical protein